MSGNWWTVFAAFLCLLFMFAVPTFMIPVLYSLIIDEFGWSRTQVTLFATVKFMSGALIGVMFGFLLDRIVAEIRKIVVRRPPVLSGIAMISQQFLASSTRSSSSTPWVLLSGSEPSGIMISMKVLVSRSFHQRQGFAIGIRALGHVRWRRADPRHYAQSGRVVRVARRSGGDE